MKKLSMMLSFMVLAFCFNSIYSACSEKGRGPRLHEKTLPQKTVALPEETGRPMTKAEQVKETDVTIAGLVDGCISEEQKAINLMGRFFAMQGRGDSDEIDAYLDALEAQKKL